MNKLNIDVELIEPFLKVQNVNKNQDCRNLVYLTKNKIYWTNQYTLATIESKESLNVDFLGVEKQPQDFKLELPLKNFFRTETWAPFTYVENLIVKTDEIRRPTLSSLKQVIEITAKGNPTDKCVTLSKDSLKTALKLIETFSKGSKDCTIIQKHVLSENEKLTYLKHEVKKGDLKLIIIQACHV